MADSLDMILPMLREMRAENLAEHEKTRQELSVVQKRLEKVEATLDNCRHALTADSLPSKLVTGEFEERIELLERKMRELEAMR